MAKTKTPRAAISEDGYGLFTALSAGLELAFREVEKRQHVPGTVAGFSG